MHPILLVAIPLGLVILGMALNSIDLGFNQPPSSTEQDPVKKLTAEKESYRKFFDQQRSRSIKRQKRVGQYAWLLLVTFIGAFIWLYADTVTKTSLSSGNRVPQQGAYIDQWKIKTVPEPAPSLQKLEDYVTAVFAALKKRDFADAEILSGKSVTQFESHPQSWLIRGIVLRLVNQMGPAYEALQKSLGLQVTRDGLTQLIHVCKATGRLEEMAALGNQLSGMGGAL